MVWRFVEHFTYAGLFLALFGGALGLPIPETAAVVAGGVLAHQAVIRWWIALPVCIAATLSGDAAVYWAGRHWGESVHGWRLVRRVLSAEREAKLLDAYRRNGVSFLFLSRHVIGIRTAASLTAGIARMPLWVFLTVDLAAVLASLPLAFGVAFFFSHHVQRLMAEIDHVTLWVIVVALVAVSALLVRHYRRTTKTTEQAES
jgi:membrane protein DedA with SNARE-associated domain